MQATVERRLSRLPGAQCSLTQPQSFLPSCLLVCSPTEPFALSLGPPIPMRPWYLTQSTQTATELDGSPSRSLCSVYSGPNVPVHARTLGQALQNPVGLVPGVEEGVSHWGSHILAFAYYPGLAELLVPTRPGHLTGKTSGM